MIVTPAGAQAPAGGSDRLMPSLARSPGGVPDLRTAAFRYATSLETVARAAIIRAELPM